MQAPMTIKQYVSQMRKIPGGRFTMGRTYSIKDPLGAYESEVPSHPVAISSFRMGSTPVTVGMWREYVRPDVKLYMPKIPPWGWIDSHPMVNVSWNDIMGTDGKGGYAAWASREAGVTLVLVSEAQWEYVAKCRKDLKYPWSNEFDDSKVFSSVKKKRTGTAAVDRLSNVFINDFGVSDLCSNVLELCLDGYQPYAKWFDRLGYVNVQRDPVGTGDQKSLRGASFFYKHQDAFRCTIRNSIDPGDRATNIGFRLVAPA